MSGPERAARDEMIRRLRGEGHSIAAIAERVKCGVATAHEVLRPDRREVYNKRRLRYWHELTGKA